jgi:hypothetical protein
VALINHVAHREGTPTRPRGILLSGEVVCFRDVVDSTGVFLVARVSFFDFFLALCLLAYGGVSVGHDGTVVAVSHIRNLRWASLFWIRRLSSGSATSCQSSDLGGLDLDGLDEEDEEDWCLLELRSGSFLLPPMADGNEDPGLEREASVALRFLDVRRGTWRLSLEVAASSLGRGWGGASSCEAFSGSRDGDALWTRIRGTYAQSSDDEGEDIYCWQD